MSLSIRTYSTAGGLLRSCGSGPTADPTRFPPRRTVTPGTVMTALRTCSGSSCALRAGRRGQGHLDLHPAVVARSRSRRSGRVRRCSPGFPDRRPSAIAAIIASSVGRGAVSPSGVQAVWDWRSRHSLLASLPPSSAAISACQAASRTSPATDIRARRPAAQAAPSVRRAQRRMRAGAGAGQFAEGLEQRAACRPCCGRPRSRPSGRRRRR